MVVCKRSQFALTEQDEPPICWFSLQLTHQAPLWGVEEKTGKPKNRNTKKSVLKKTRQRKIRLNLFLFCFTTMTPERWNGQESATRGCGLTSRPRTWAAPREPTFPSPSSDCRCVRWRWRWRPRTRAGPWRSRPPWEQPPRTGPGGNLLLSATDRQTTPGIPSYWNYLIVIM